MTLHEVIEKVLKEYGQPQTTQELADKLNKLGWYTKKEGSEITAFQIHGRTRNYADLFKRDGTKVYLLGGSRKPRKAWSDKPKTISSQLTGNPDLQEKVLLNAKNFKSFARLESDIPSVPGVYAILIDKPSALPKPFSSILKERGTDLIYIGQASQSLRTRLYEQELLAMGHGTFFRSLGAALGYTPPIGSLIHMGNKYNYKFAAPDEQKIIGWIKQHLRFNWIDGLDDIDSLEKGLIRKHQPIINIKHNPAPVPELLALRKNCQDIANGKT